VGINKNKIISLITVLFAAVILLLEVFLGMGSAKSQKQSEFAVKNAQTIEQALKYFYSDQERFPYSAEFEDRNIMGSYFSVFPVPQIPNPACPKTFIYKQLSQQEAELDVCLPKAFGGYSAGWNKISIK
jgi:hypothetical protein